MLNGETSTIPCVFDYICYTPHYSCVFIGCKLLQKGNKSRASIFQLLNLKPHRNANVSRLSNPASSLVACWWQTEARDLQAFETPCKLQIGDILNLKQGRMSIRIHFFSRPDISRIKDQNPDTWFNEYLAMNTCRHLKLTILWTKGWCKPSWQTCTLNPPPAPPPKWIKQTVPKKLRHLQRCLKDVCFAMIVCGVKLSF